MTAVVTLSRLASTIGLVPEGTDLFIGARATWPLPALWLAPSHQCALRHARHAKKTSGEACGKPCPSWYVGSPASALYWSAIGPVHLKKKIGHVRLLEPGGRPIFDGGRGGSNARRFCSLNQLSILRRAAPAACAFVPVNLAVVDFPSALSG
jgi:hypothetical protein